MKKILRISDKRLTDMIAFIKDARDAGIISWQAYEQLGRVIHKNRKQYIDITNESVEHDPVSPLFDEWLAKR